MTPRFARPITLVLGLLTAGFSLTLTACDEDPFGPVDWPASGNVVTDTLFSLARAEHFLEPGAFDVHSLDPIVVENALVPAFSYDFLLGEDDTGALVFLPTGFFPDATVRPGLRRDSSGLSFDEIESAPREGYIEEDPVDIEVGGVYLVKARAVGNCPARYGKMEVLAVNAPDGTVELRILRNPNCNERSLVPTIEPEEEEAEEEDGGEG